MYPFTRIGFGSASRRAFRNLDTCLTRLVSIKVKAFALELVKAVVLILYPLHSKVHRVVKLFLPINQLKLIYVILTPFDPKGKTFFKVPLFLILL